VRAVATYAVASARACPRRVVVASGAIALVVVATGLLASLAGHVERTLVATADPRNLIVLAAAASSEGTSILPFSTVHQLRDLPGIDRASDGTARVSAELVVEAALRRGGQDPRGRVDRATEVGAPIAVVARGLEPGALSFHEGVRLEGRWPRRGAREALVGAALARRLGGPGRGDRIELGRHEWEVVGTFAAGGSAYEHEVWLDRNDLANDSARTAGVSTVRLRARSPADLRSLARRIEADAAIQVQALGETAFYERQAHVARALRGLLGLTAVLSGTAAAAGLANLFHASVEARRREIGLLRAIGFGRGWIVGAVQLEALAVAVVGVATGALTAAFAAPRIGAPLGAWLGIAGSTAAPGDAAVLELAAIDLAPGLVLALAIGIAAAFGPARRAARLRPAEVLRGG
jgi:putative ABC transport system permease protein